MPAYRVPAKPTNDDEHLELIARVLFVMGFRYSIVEERWPKIRKAFHNFKISWVAKADVEALAAADGMIKNRVKLKRIIENAKECENMIKEYGSMDAWVEKTAKEHDENPIWTKSLAEEIQDRFAGIGKTTREWLAYVFKDGKDEPEVRVVEESP